MRMLVEAIPCDVSLPTEVVPVLPATPFSYRKALDALDMAILSDEERSVIEAAARTVAKAVVVRTQIDAVLLPLCLRPEVRSTLHAVAEGILSWELEARGLLTLLPVVSVRGDGLAVIPDNLLTWEAMREPDPCKRSECWRKRWNRLLAREAGMGGESMERKLFAGYLADDADALSVIASSDPTWSAELARERAGTSPVPWRRAVREMQRLPTS